MKKLYPKLIKGFTALVAALSLAPSVFPSAVTRVAAGANPAAIQAAVDQFRTDLGGANNGVGGSFRTGRREINWDGVPNAQSQPNQLPFNFFNVTSPRGLVLHSIQNNAAAHTFRVSASAASGTAVRFGDIDPTYSTIFQAFSAEKIFHAAGSNVIEILFFIPGTNIPATVSGFGAVFCDVDASSNTFIEFYASDGSKLSGNSLNTANNGLSFIGASFNAGERVAKVIIRLGNANLQSANVDGTNSVDVVAMDDFIYGEPRAQNYGEGDFDGDGTSDITVFRPSTGNWFTFQSGSNTVFIDQFGQAGDIPVAGDYDGDRLADTAIYRPSLGQWWFKRSSNGTNFASTFGTSTDRPVPGDYDKDGKNDLAFHRPGTNEWFVARSVDNYESFFSVPFGAAGDIPVGVQVNP